MNVIETEIPDIKILSPERFGDHRGFFSETYNRRALAEAGLELDFVQDNDSLTAEPGTVRGLHFQVPPFAQHKLVRVVRGAILDVAVDLRRGSPTRGRHVAVQISAEEWNQVFVPAGFAHGFCTLKPDTHIVYKVTSHYSPQHDKGLLWSDPALGIQWPVSAAEAVLSQRDTQWPRLAELPDYFD
ncbi:MAG: dTDP-4-dehydrorhamnose 3,5-epimerase [Planctomycetota bacterium]